MNDNLNEIINDTESEAVIEQTLSEIVENDLSTGLHSVLYRPINDVTIRDIRIRDVFTRFLKEIECGDSITVNDILMAAEKCVCGGEPDENAGNYIYTYDANSVSDKKIANKLIKNSVGNIYSLFSIHNGLTLELGLLGGSIAAAESKRYLIVPQKKAEKFNSIAKKGSVTLSKVGEVISTNRILISENSDVVASIDKTLIQSSAPTKVDIGTEHFAAFLAGYNAVCSLALCNCVSSNNIIRFGLDGSLSEICARALGFFGALTYLKTIPVRVVYVPDNNATVAVSRPKVVDGDYLYLLKLRKDAYELPDKGHFGQLYYYLNEKKRNGIIKDVLPCGENINRVIKRLCTDELTYDSLTEIPENCFGVIVSVSRGESVNGIRLGCFKNI